MLVVVYLVWRFHPTSAALIRARSTATAPSIQPHYSSPAYSCYTVFDEAVRLGHPLDSIPKSAMDTRGKRE